MSNGGHSMGSTSLQEAFEQMLEQQRNDWGTKQLKPIIDGIREAAVELQEAGFSVSLEFRPKGSGFPDKLDETAYANGTLSIDGLKIDFAILRNSSNYRGVQLYLGTTPYDLYWASFGDTEKEKGVKGFVLQKTLEAKARRDLLSESDVHENRPNFMPGKPAPPKLGA